MSLPRVVVFDPDPEMLHLICAQLSDGGGMSVVPCRTIDSVFGEMVAEPADLLITEGRIPEIGVSAFLAKLEAHAGGFFPPNVLVVADPALAEGGGLTGACRSRILTLPKPFDRAGLLALVRANVSHAPEQGGNLLRIADLTLNPSSFDVHLGAERIHLTNSEFKLLHELMANPDATLSRDHLIQKVQGEGIAVIDRAVDTHVFALRKKLGDTGDRIETVRGIGYRIRSGDAQSSAWAKK